MGRKSMKNALLDSLREIKAARGVDALIFHIADDQDEVAIYDMGTYILISVENAVSLTEQRLNIEKTQELCENLQKWLDNQ